MKYMLLVYLDEQALSETEREHCYVESAQLARELSTSGKYIASGPLHPVATATSVRVRNGKRLVTDGPFADTREQLGGYYIIDAKDLDEAMSIAERVPPANVGTIEIRPLLEIEGLPSK
jgi:hypothetical protein